jgi:hypothetical protein
MQFKESVRSVTGTAIKFLTPDIAVAHVRWGIRGDKDPDGTPRQPRHGVMMEVLMKRGGKWAVVAAQKTNVWWGETISRTQISGRRRLGSR